MSATVFSRRLLSIASACLLVLGSQTAMGEKGGVIVLPMTSTSKSLEIYGTATAMALAKGLRRAGIKVEAVASVADIPRGTRVIIDGRLVAEGKDRVKLEARVRRAETGQSLTTRATEPAHMSNIDSLVSTLAESLAPAMLRALEPLAPIRLPTTVVQGETAQLAKIPVNEDAASVPDIIVLPASGSAADGLVSVREPATSGAYAMLARLGLHAEASASLEGIASPEMVSAEIKARGARFALMVHVRQVRFSYNIVLSARGSVRVVLVGEGGDPLFDKTVYTDTVVGSRGDRHQALVFCVAEQALDMLLPQFKRVAGPSHTRRGTPGVHATR